MSEWERVFLQNLAIPPHGQRRRARLPRSAAFRCVLKHLEGAALTQVRWRRSRPCGCRASPRCVPSALLRCHRAVPKPVKVEVFKTVICFGEN